MQWDEKSARKYAETPSCSFLWSYHLLWFIYWSMTLYHPSNIMLHLCICHPGWCISILICFCCAFFCSCFSWLLYFDYLYVSMFLPPVCLYVAFHMLFFLLFYCLYFLLLFYPSNHCLQLILIRVMGEWPIPTTIGQEGGYTLDGSPIWVLCVAGLTERQTAIHSHTPMCNLESPKQNFIVIYCYHLYWQLVVCIFASFSCFFVLIYLMSILPLFTRWSMCNLCL